MSSPQTAVAPLAEPPMIRSRFDNALQWDPLSSWQKTCEATVCPCVVLGRVASVVSGEKRLPACCFGRSGLGRMGARLCVTTACCPITMPYCVIRQRWRLMRFYGIRGGWCEAAKGIIVPYALAQHSHFVADKKRLRWPWESPNLWNTSARPPSQSFHVIIFGSPGAGVSSLVRALVGAERPACQVKGAIRHQPTFSVASRLVQVPGYPIAVLNLWEIDTEPEVDMPLSFRQEADAVLAVFNADLRHSLDDTVSRYQQKFPQAVGIGDPNDKVPSPEFHGSRPTCASRIPPVRVLLGNVHQNRAIDDRCEFLNDVDAAARRLDMQVSMLSAHAPSSQGTKPLLETLTKQIWEVRRKDTSAADSPATMDVHRPKAL